MINPLSDIRHYSPKLNISQLIKFFKKKEMHLTRGMVQNYVRDGNLPPPLERRFYTHKHVAALVIICKLKTVFDMHTIRLTLAPIMDHEGLSLDLYSQLFDNVQSLIAKFTETGELQNYRLLQMLLIAELKAKS